LPQYKNHTNVVGAVLKDSPAEKAGLKQEDQVVSIDGVSVGNFFELSKIVNVRPAKSVEIVVKREGQLHTLNVELGEKGNPIDGKTG
ncbi:PDZ domain-containing protein, partial [Vibrio cholerae]